MNLRILLCPAAFVIALIQQPAQVVVDVTLATVGVTVTTQSGQLVTSLTAQDFALYENGVRQEIRSFDITQKPHRILAASQCAALPNDDLLQRAFRRFIDGVRPQARLALGEFVTGIKLLRDWDATSLFSAVPLRQPGIGCMVQRVDFDVALNWLVAKSQSLAGDNEIVWFGVAVPSQRFVSVKNPYWNGVAGGPFGDDDLFKTVPPAEDAEFQRQLAVVRDSRVTFHFATILQEAYLLARGVMESHPWTKFYLDLFRENEQQRLLRLKLMAEVSGGQLILVKSPNDIRPLIDRLNSVPETSYVLGYAPAKRAEGATAPRIEVRAKDTKLRVWTSR